MAKKKKALVEKSEPVFGVIAPGRAVMQAEMGRTYQPKPQRNVEEERTSIKPSYYPFEARVSPEELRRREKKKRDDYAA